MVTINIIHHPFKNQAWTGGGPEIYTLLETKQTYDPRRTQGGGSRTALHPQIFTAPAFPSPHHNALPLPMY